MSSILGLLLAGAVVSTAIKVGIVVIGAKAYWARRRNKAQAAPPEANGTPAPAPAPPTTVEQAPLGGIG